MTHPYEGLPPSAFWRSAVAEPGPHGLSGLWSPKFPIRKTDVIATAGSCFAQHIGRELVANGYGWTDFEPAPPFLTDEDCKRFNYGVFSFRTGNIYTPSMLLQWLRLAYGEAEEDPEIWREGNRVWDPLRPAVEPGGFADEAECRAARQSTYKAIRAAVERADVFVFTLGLTESWRNAQTGLEYALCPGTVAGEFDASRHVFDNANARAVSRSLSAAAKFMRRKNPGLRILLTVSPVPLTATASGQHVLTATSYSKSTLRAAAAMVADDRAWIDYFPSYEIVTHPVFRGMAFAPNMRSVDPAGVAVVMRHFFADQFAAFGKPRGDKKRNAALERPVDANAVLCEEEMLDAFAR